MKMFLTSIITTLVLIPIWQDSQEIEFVTKAKVGQKMSITIESNAEFLYKTRDDLGKETQEKIKLASKSSFLQETTQIENNESKVLDVKCISSTVEKTSTTGTTSSKSPLDGRAFILTRIGNSYRVALKGKEDIEDKEELSVLGKWEDYRYLLPRQKVKVGARWEGESDEMVSIFLGKENSLTGGKFVCILKEINDRAIISIELKARGEKGKNGEISTDLIGELQFNTKRGVPEQIKLKGNVKFTKSTIMEGKTYNIEASSQNVSYSIKFEEK